MFNYGNTRLEKKYQLYHTQREFIMFYQRFMKFYTFNKNTMNRDGWWSCFRDGTFEVGIAITMINSPPESFPQRFSKTNGFIAGTRRLGSF